MEQTYSSLQSHFRNLCVSCYHHDAIYSFVTVQLSRSTLVIRSVQQALTSQLTSIFPELVDPGRLGSFHFGSNPLEPTF